MCCLFPAVYVDGFLCFLCLLLSLLSPCVVLCGVVWCRVVRVPLPPQVVDCFPVSLVSHYRFVSLFALKPFPFFVLTHNTLSGL